MSLLIGFQGTELDAQAQAWLKHGKVAGVVLFARNFVDPAQLRELVAQIRSVRKRTLIAVDQEGGSVQRFGQGFSRLPALGRIGALYARDPAAGREACLLHAWLMATEVLAHDVDLSLAPVADLGLGNAAIGDRAFSEQATIAAKLTALYVERMWRCGMAATLKHFPGHGAASGDTHTELTSDPRSLGAMARADLIPFATGIAAGAHAVMMGHVIYPQVDPRAAGYSRRWIGEVLRQTLKFRGVVMSDDVSMRGGADVGDVAARVKAHYKAGCELVLVCQPEAVDEALAVKPQPRLNPTKQRLLKARDPRWARSMLEGAEFADRLRRLWSLLE